MLGGSQTASSSSRIQLAEGRLQLLRGRAQAGQYGSQYDSGYHAYNAYAGYQPTQEAEEPDPEY
eukprot:420477-Rhodomonas_salina.1